MKIPTKRANRLVLKSIRIALKYPWKTLKEIADGMGVNYKTLHSSWSRRGISLRDIRENGFNGEYKIIH